MNPKDRLILEAAAENFAIKGYSGARMDEIAKDANVNKATIYYRLGDKASLYEMVYAVILDTMHSELTTSCGEVDDPVTALRHYIKTIALLCENNPFMSRIILREVASQGQHISDGTLKKMHQIRLILASILTNGEKSGQFKAVNGFLIHTLVIGFLNFYTAGKPISDKLSGLEENDKNESILPISQVSEELAELILNSISKN